MQTEKGLNFSREDFISSDWQTVISSAGKHGYSSLWQAFNKSSDTYSDNGAPAKAQMMHLLAQACSMMLNPTSINEPFEPILKDFQKGRRSQIPDDFTSEQLVFFESILDDIDEPYLRGRVADLLWLCKRPRNPGYAKVAIEVYISHPINPETWLRDINKCWERAILLCIQIKDSKKLKDISEKLYNQFRIDHPESPFMPLWIAELIDRHGLCQDNSGDISQRLFLIAKAFIADNNYRNARSYLTLAEKKYRENKNEEGWLDSLTLIAECYESEADQRSAESMPSQMAANSLYENAIQAYRRIPVKHREKYGVENKLHKLREKLSQSGEASLGEMGLIRTPAIDISKMIETSVAHVSGKQSVEEALMYFIGLYNGPDFRSLQKSAEETIAKHPLSAIFGSTHMSSDGRVVAKTPALSFNDKNDPANQSVLSRQIKEHFSIEMQLAVDGQILPALRQILMEHRVTIHFLEAICYHSPLVPQQREKLSAAGLYYGFEYNFANAIHMLCPQLEHMVRVQLKMAGAHTTTVDSNGIEHESGLSSLLVLPEAIQVFGENTLYELRALFADPIGPNLRNEVAHGLLDDLSATSISSVYAWWMVLRLIMGSLMGLSLNMGNGNIGVDE